MKNLGKITLFGIFIAGGFLTSLLGTKIILSIAELYQLSFISCYSFLQVYGVISIFNLLKYKREKTKEEKESFNELIKKGFGEIIIKTFFLLIAWGFSFLAFYILS
jgi:hypothetical protein